MATLVIDTALAEEGRRLVVELLRSLRAYDVMKETYKIIVYDTLLPFKHAYFSLVEYGALGARACCALLPVLPHPPLLLLPSPTPACLPPSHPPQTLCARPCGMASAAALRAALQCLT
jgi:hypothetical protein